MGMVRPVHKTQPYDEVGGVDGACTGLWVSLLETANLRSPGKTSWFLLLETPSVEELESPSLSFCLYEHGVHTLVSSAHL